MMSNLHEFKAMAFQSEAIENSTQLKKALTKAEYYARRNLQDEEIVEIRVTILKKTKFIKPKDRTALGINNLDGTCAET